MRQRLSALEAAVCEARGYEPDAARAALATVEVVLALASLQIDGSAEQRRHLQSAVDRAEWAAELVKRQQLGEEAAPALVAAWVASGYVDDAITRCETVGLESSWCATAYYLRYAASRGGKDRLRLMAVLGALDARFSGLEGTARCARKEAEEALRIALIADLLGERAIARSRFAWLLTRCTADSVAPGMVDVFPWWVRARPRPDESADALRSR